MFAEILRMLECVHGKQPNNCNEDYLITQTPILNCDTKTLLSIINYDVFHVPYDNKLKVP